MEGMPSIPLTVLFHFDSFTIILAIFNRDIVPTLAVLTSQGHFDSLLIFSHL